VEYSSYLCLIRVGNGSQPNKQKIKIMKTVKVSFEISNVSDETIRALQKYLYETLEFSELISSDEECSNLEIIETSNK
jgi:hypothetical protein